MIESATVVKIDNEKAKAVIVCRTSNKESYFCLVIKRLIGNTNKVCWCFYVGLTPEQYAVLCETEKAKQDYFSFLGIAGDVIFIHSQIASTLLADQPTHFVGTHVWGEDMESTDGEALTQHCISLCQDVLTELQSQPGLIES